ncbi:Rho GTPase activation protein [Paraphysoderma sedebokerense]|nr:Rho GTPase activation protein [Paraphysoderma sedebokerense]
MILKNENMTWCTNCYIPAFYHNCAMYILKNGITTPGIFRISGSTKKTQLLMKEYENGRFAKGFPEGIFMVEDQEIGVHEVAALMKLFLRDLPVAIFNQCFNSLYKEVATKTLDITAEDAIQRMIYIETLRDLLILLDSSSIHLLKYTLDLFHEIAKEQGQNKMNVTNLVKVFVPSLFRLEVADLKWAMKFLEIIILADREASKNGLWLCPR